MTEVERSVARARVAQRVAEGYDQARVDELVLAAGWAIMEPARNQTAGRTRRGKDTGLGNVPKTRSTRITAKP